jgi:quercetin dioxygenase-like cupin family protein
MKNSFWLFGANLTVLSSESQTGSGYDLIEGIFPPGAVTPLHLHTKYTETIYVVEGEVTVYTPGAEYVLRAGDSHFIPKNTAHAVVNNLTDKPFKALAIASPGGFSRLIETAGIADGPDDLPPDVPNDMALALQILEEIGDKILGAPGTRPRLP